MNERELRVFRILADELRALCQEIHAARKDQQSSSDTSEHNPVQPLQIEIAATHELDPARREYYEAENNEKKSLWRQFKPWVETIGVLVAVGLAVLTLLTMLEIRKQTPAIATSAAAAKSAAQTASDSLTAVQRPFIGYKTLTNENIPDRSGKVITGIEFKARYENTGTTPTRGARHRITFQDFPNGMPADFNFRLDGRGLIDTVFAFGPKTAIDAGQVFVSKKTMDQVLVEKTHLYFWGWLEYRDVFHGTPDHITMFCVQLTEIEQVTMPDPRRSVSNMRYTNCPKHNCEDEDCDGQRYGDGQIWHAVKR